MNSITYPSAEPLPRPWKARHFIVSERTWFWFICLTFASFCFRDTLTGAMRFYLQMFHVDPLWFVSDILSVAVLVYFVVQVVAKNRSIFGGILLVNLVTATIVGVLFMSSNAFTIFSSVKLFLPIFVGFAFCGRSVVSVPWLRWFLLFMSIVSTAGLMAGPHIDLPWVGAQVENFGQTKAVGRLIWAGGEMRYGGFAGDNTMAAYMTIFPYILIHRYLPRWSALLLWPAFAYALHNSNSKTAMLISVLFIAYFFISPSWEKRGILLERTTMLAKWSFIFVPVPFLLMFLLGGIDLSSISPTLFSMQDRINNTWQFPFTALSDIAPYAVVSGCGLGCFTYPMLTTELANLYVPVDNFYIATYLMFGFPFIITIVGMATAAWKSRDIEKLLLMAMINVYSVTVQCYGPSTATIMIGYAFSDMFLTGVVQWKRRRSATIQNGSTLAAAG